jgi:hypothetical protein
MAVLHKGDDEIAERFGGTGFAKVAFDASTAEFKEARAGGLGRDDGDLDGHGPSSFTHGSEGRIGEDGVGEFNAVHFGHVKVGEDEIDRVLGEDLEGLFPVAGFVDRIDGELGELDGAFDEAAGSGRVIDEEDGETHENTP